MAQDPKKESKPPLPVDRGQFGRSDATEDYKPLAPPPNEAAPGGADKPGGQDTD